MLASGDYVTPRLNGIPYFEKPPLLYWANAASMRLFGATPWAARLPTRLFGLGTVIVLVLGTAAAWGAETGLAAGILYLASPYGFLFSRVNLTDAPLTFFFTATLFLARAAIARREARLPWKLLSLLTGLAAAGGFLSKGLIAIVLPGGILLLWCILARRTRFLSALLAGPALPAFLLASAPWFSLARKTQSRASSTSSSSMSTSSASRPRSTCGRGRSTTSFSSSSRDFFRRSRSSFRRCGAPASPDDRDAQFFLIWFAVVLVFFSVSRSKLPPYLLPAIPAAAALAARSVVRPAARGFRRLALLRRARGAPAGGGPDRPDAPRVGPRIRPHRHRGRRPRRPSPRIVRALSRCRSDPPRSAAFALACGWAGFGIMAALAWPRLPNATGPHALAAAAVAARDDGATVVGYQAYLQGLPLALASPIPLADYVGELEPQFLRTARVARRASLDPRTVLVGMEERPPLRRPRPRTRHGRVQGRSRPGPRPRPEAVLDRQLPRMRQDEGYDRAGGAYRRGLVVPRSRPSGPRHPARSARRNLALPLTTR